MIGTLVNAAAVIVGTVFGLLLKKGLPEKIVNAVMQAVGLCVMYVGISGLDPNANSLVVIIAMAVGTAVGTLINIDGGLDKFSKKVESLVTRGNSTGTVAQGFMTASLIFCVGSMAIMGPLTSGLTGDNSILYTKSLLDGITSIMLTASLGWGVMLSSVFVLVYQGAIALLSGVLSGVLQTAAADIICTGSIMIIALGLNMTGITKIKVANFLPALIVAPVASWIASLL